MDPSSHTAALELTIAWLHDAPVWNFGRFNDAINQQFYPLLKYPFPLPKDWDETRKTEIRSIAKERKREIYRCALQHLARSEDLEIARKAICALRITPAALWATKSKNNVCVNVIQLAPPNNTTSGAEVPAQPVPISSRPVVPPPYPTTEHHLARKRVKVSPAEASEEDPLHEYPQVPVQLPGKSPTPPASLTIATPPLVPPVLSTDIPRSLHNSLEDPESTNNSESAKISPSAAPSVRDEEDTSEINNLGSETNPKANHDSPASDFHNTLDIEVPPVPVSQSPQPFQRIYSECIVCCRHLFSAMNCKRCCSHPTSRQASEPPLPPSRLASPKITPCPPLIADPPTDPKIKCLEQQIQTLEERIQSQEQQLQEQEERLNMHDQRIKFQEEMSEAVTKVISLQYEMDKTLSWIRNAPTVSKKRSRGEV